MKEKKEHKNEYLVNFKITEKDKEIHIELDTSGDELSITQMVNYLLYCSNLLMKKFNIQ